MQNIYGVSKLIKLKKPYRT